jgi:hypothetical protein
MVLRLMLPLVAIMMLCACGMMPDIHTLTTPSSAAPSASSASTLGYGRHEGDPPLLTKEESDAQTQQQWKAAAEKKEADAARRGADREASAHRGHVYELTHGITGKMDQPPHLEAMDTPSDARTTVVQPVLELQAQLRQYDADAADKLQARVDAWSAGVDKQIADEEKCRQTPQCMGDRIALPLCDAIADRRDAAQSIVKERSNPGGVVDLSALHDLGQRIQQDDAAIASLKRQYASAVHKSFSEASCKR